MKIQYKGDHGQIVAGEVIGDLAKWQPGQVREFAPNTLITVRERVPENPRESRLVARPAADVFFGLGRDFVDADTGKNPRLQCSVCGGVTLAESFMGGQYTREVAIPYVDADGNRLCVRDFLRANPQHVENHARRHGFDIALLDDIAPEADAAAGESRPADVDDEKELQA